LNFNCEGGAPASSFTSHYCRHLLESSAAAAAAAAAASTATQKIFGIWDEGGA